MPRPKHASARLAAPDPPDDEPQPEPELEDETQDDPQPEETEEVATSVAAFFTTKEPPMAVDLPTTAPSPYTIPAPSRPTLDDAFYLLAGAMSSRLLDNLPAYTHTQDIQSWYANAGTDPAGQTQKITAWRHAIQLLEQLLGQKLGS